MKPTAAVHRKTMVLKQRWHKFVFFIDCHWNLSTNNNDCLKLQTLATMAQSFLLIRLGMELSISLIVIRDLYQNPNKEFPLTVTEVSWYGMY